MFIIGTFLRFNGCKFVFIILYKLLLGKQNSSKHVLSLRLYISHNYINVQINYICIVLYYIYVCNK